MQFSQSFFLFLLLVILAACEDTETVAKKTIVQKREEERGKKNPVQKGRYRCYLQLPAGDKQTSPLYILSDEMYQVDDEVGRYVFDTSGSIIQWVQGPMKHAVDPVIGVYTAKGAPTTGGGQALESMIAIYKKSDRDAGNKKIVMQCNCSQFEY